MPLDSLTYDPSLNETVPGLPGWSVADLAEARAALERVLEHAPGNAPHLLAALYDGRVDGRHLGLGEVRCVMGWGVDFSSGRSFDATLEACRRLCTGAIEWLACPPLHHAEGPTQFAPCGGGFFMPRGPGISRGDTPATNPVSALVAHWVAAWMAGHEHRRLLAECAPGCGA